MLDVGRPKRQVVKGQGFQVAIAYLYSLGRCTLQVISTARTCNLILIVLDSLKPITHKRLIEHELEGFGIRLNKKPPNIQFRYELVAGSQSGAMLRFPP